jgi:hypothetical protein
LVRCKPGIAALSLRRFNSNGVKRFNHKSSRIASRGSHAIKSQRLLDAISIPSVPYFTDDDYQYGEHHDRSGQRCQRRKHFFCSPPSDNARNAQSKDLFQGRCEYSQDGQNASNKKKRLNSATLLGVWHSPTEFTRKPPNHSVALQWIRRIAI